MATFVISKILNLTWDNRIRLLRDISFIIPHIDPQRENALIATGGRNTELDGVATLREEGGWG